MFSDPTQMPPHPFDQIAEIDPYLGSGTAAADTESGGPDLTIDLSEEERQALGSLVARQIRRYLDDVGPRRQNGDQWRRDFEMMPASDTERWKGSANVCAPFTHIYCQTHHVRLNEQIVEKDPPLTVIARTPEAQSIVAKVQEAMEAALEESEWAEAATELHAELPVMGNCFLRVSYEIETAKVPSYDLNLDTEKFETMTALGADPQEAYLQMPETDAQGNPKLSFSFKTVIKTQGVQFKVIPFEDGIILPSSVRHPREARAMGERLMIRGGDLKEGAKHGRYLEDAVERVLAGGDSQPADRAERLDHQGVVPDPGAQPETPEERLFECYELCYKYDADEDGVDEWVILTLHLATQTIVRLQYMPYEHGENYYHLFRYFTRARELWGMGVAEKVAGLQDAGTAVLNQLIDHGDLALNAMGNILYDSTSGLDPDKWNGQLNTPIKVDNVDGIAPLPIHSLPNEHYSIYQLLKDAADLVTAASNPSLGKATDTEKTLGEVQIVAASGNLAFEEVASRVARDWAKVWDQVRWLEAQFGDGEVVYRKSAAPGKMMQGPDGQAGPAAMVGGEMTPAVGGVAFGTITANELLTDVDIVPAGLRQLSDLQSRIQQANLVMTISQTHPLLVGNLEAQYVILDDYLQVMRYPHRLEVLAAVTQQLDAMAQAQQMAAMLGGSGAPGEDGAVSDSGSSPPGTAPLPASGRAAPGTPPPGYAQPNTTMQPSPSPTATQPGQVGPTTAHHAAKVF